MESGTPEIIYVYATAGVKFNSSVQDKILQQISAARENSVKMTGWFFTAETNLPADTEQVRWFSVPEVNTGYFRSWRQQNVTYECIHSVLKEKLKKGTCIYIRYWAPCRSLLKVTKSLSNALVFNHVAIEQADINAFKSVSHSKIARLLGTIEFRTWPWLANRTFGKKIRRLSGRAVVNSEEIAVHQKKMAGGRYNCLVVADGISTSRYPARQAPGLSDVLKIVMLKGASIDAQYNGIDRLLQGIKQYQGDKKLQLTVIGDNLDTEKQYAESEGLSEYVDFKPRLSQAELDKELQQYHLGAGTLALHRKGLRSNSSIKSREYFSRGIPFFYAHHDADISDNIESGKFCLCIAEGEQPVDCSELVDFAERVYSNPRHAEQMHDFAVRNLDHRIKMKKITDFILNKTADE